MSKRLYIHSVDMNRGRSYSYDHDLNHLDESCYLVAPGEKEYENIYLDHEISDEEIQHAIDVLITYIMQNQARTLEVDLDIRNREFAPPKEMTLEEVERELGYKIKIITKEN